MTKLCSGQGNPDAATATANESNPYMSPIQVTLKGKIYFSKQHKAQEESVANKGIHEVKEDSER